MICFIRSKNLQDYYRSLLLLCYMFCLTVFIKKVFQNSWRKLHLLTLHPKLIFRDALKKAFMVPEDRSYQIQYFAKIFPSALISALHIHSIAIFRDSLQYPFHHFLLPRTRFISRRNFLKATCHSFPRISYYDGYEVWALTHVIGRN